MNLYSYDPVQEAIYNAIIPPNSIIKKNKNNGFWWSLLIGAGTAGITIWIYNNIKKRKMPKLAEVKTEKNYYSSR